MIMDYSNVSGFALLDNGFVFRDRECEIQIEGDEEEYLFEKLNQRDSYVNIAQRLDKEIEFNLIATITCG